MATYKEIQNYIKEKYNSSIKTCWIADMKEKNGIYTKPAPNRISKSERIYPCPDSHQDKIKDAFVHFGMVNEK